MSDGVKLRTELNAARERIEGMGRAVDQAITALHEQDDRRLRLYVGIVAAEVVRLRMSTRKACDALNRMPLDGLLEKSLAGVKTQ